MCGLKSLRKWIKAYVKKVRYERSQTAKMKLFPKIAERKKLHLRCLTGFWMRLCEKFSVNLCPLEKVYRIENSGNWLTFKDKVFRYKKKCVTPCWQTTKQNIYPAIKTRKLFLIINLSFIIWKKPQVIEEHKTNISHTYH